MPFPPYDEGDIAELNAQDADQSKRGRKWDNVIRLLGKLYRVWAKSTVPWHEEVNDLMRAYDKWLD